MFLRLLDRILSCHLRRKRRTFSRTFKPLRSGRRPGDNVAAEISDCNNSIVKGRLNMHNSFRYVLFFLFFPCFSYLFCHLSSESIPSLFLLASNRPPRSFPRSSICTRSLAPDRKSFPMPQSTVSPEIHQSLNCHRHVSS